MFFTEFGRIRSYLSHLLWVGNHENRSVRWVRSKFYPLCNAALRSLCIVLVTVDVFLYLSDANASRRGRVLKVVHHDVAVLLVRRRRRLLLLVERRYPLRHEVVRREAARVNERRRQRRTQNVVTVQDPVSGMERVVVAVGPLVRVRPLDVFVGRQVGGDEVCVEAGETKDAERRKKSRFKSNTEES